MHFAEFLNEGEGWPELVKTLRLELEPAAEEKPKRLFTTNTGACEGEIRSIGADTCPVLEG